MWPLFSHLVHGTICRLRYVWFWLIFSCGLPIFADVSFHVVPRHRWLSGSSPAVCAELATSRVFHNHTLTPSPSIVWVSALLCGPPVCFARLYICVVCVIVFGGPMWFHLLVVRWLNEAPRGTGVGWLYGAVLPSTSVVWSTDEPSRPSDEWGLCVGRVCRWCVRVGPSPCSVGYALFFNPLCFFVCFSDHDSL